MRDPVTPETPETLVMQVSAFLFARHRVQVQGNPGPVHAHSWQVDVELGVPIQGVINPQGFHIPSAELRTLLEEVLAPYQDQLLNHVPPFDQVPPTAEMIALVLFYQVQERVRDRGLVVHSLTLQEGLTRRFVVRGTGQALLAEIAPRSLREVAVAAMAEEPEPAAPVGAGATVRQPTRPPRDQLQRGLPLVPPLQPTPRPDRRAFRFLLAATFVTPILYHARYFAALPAGPAEPGRVWWLLAAALGGVSWLGHTRYLGLPLAAGMGILWALSPSYRLLFAAGDLGSAVLLGLVPLVLALARDGIGGQDPLARLLTAAFLCGALLARPRVGVALAVALALWALAHRIATGRGRWVAEAALALAALGACALALALQGPAPAHRFLPADSLLRSLAVRPAQLDAWVWVLWAAVGLTLCAWPRLPAWERGGLTASVVALGGCVAALKLLRGTPWAAALLDPPLLLALALAGPGLALAPLLSQRRTAWASALLPGMLLVAALLTSGYRPSPLAQTLRAAARDLPVAGRVALVGLPGQTDLVQLAARTPAGQAPDTVPGGNQTEGALSQALAGGWTPFVADRLAELGVTHVLAGTEMAEGAPDLWLQPAGFRPVRYYPGAVLLARPPAPGSAVAYAAMAIGTGALNWSSVFPTVALAPSPYLDQVPVEELARYRLVILSGPQWRSQKAAEVTVRELLRRQVQVILDPHGMPVDPASRRPNFLNIGVESVMLTAMPALAPVPEGARIPLGPLPAGVAVWESYVPQGVHEELLAFQYLGERLTAVGRRHLPEGSVTVVGLNLAAYAARTGDAGAVQALERLTGLRARQMPPRAALQGSRTDRDGEQRLEVVVPEGAGEVILAVAAGPGHDLRLGAQPAGWSVRHGMPSLRLPPGPHTVVVRAPRPPRWATWAAAAVWGAGTGWWVALSLTGRKRRARGKAAHGT